MTKSIQDGTKWTSQRARLRDGMMYRRVHPSVDPQQWYPVVDPEELGFYLEQGGALRFVSWEQFDVRESGPNE